MDINVFRKIMMYVNLVTQISHIVMYYIEYHRLQQQADVRTQIHTIFSTILYLLTVGQIWLEAAKMILLVNTFVDYADEREPYKQMIKIMIREFVQMQYLTYCKMSVFQNFIDQMLPNIINQALAFCVITFFIFLHFPAISLFFFCISCS